MPSALSFLAFLVELAMFALLAAAGVRFGDGAASSVALALAFAGSGVILWARWMAPRSEHRLPHPRRLVAQVALFAGAAALAIASGLVLKGAAVFAVGVGTFAALGGR